MYTVHYISSRVQPGNSLYTVHYISGHIQTGNSGYSVLVVGSSQVRVCKMENVLLN